jgi:hypothetical protein
MRRGPDSAGAKNALQKNTINQDLPIDNYGKSMYTVIVINATPNTPPTTKGV